MTSHLPVHSGRHPRRYRRFALASLAGVAVLAAACGSSAEPASSPTTAAAPTGTVARRSGPVDVLYAGSLVDLMNDDIGPGFHSATGYTFSGTSGDSGSLANEIKGKVERGDVFISANPSKNAGLEGTANGSWVSWYAEFATSPLVIGYNPKSKFAKDLQTMPWYKVVTMPGFLLGRTDPATDPKGVLAVDALDRAATTDDEPALRTLATSTSNVYAENSLVGRLQAGQLDAGFFYGVEAKVADIPTVPIPGSSLGAAYTITVLNNAPHPSAADAFVSYLLGSEGAAALEKGGLVRTEPATVSGPVPASLQKALSGS